MASIVSTQLKLDYQKVTSKRVNPMKFSASGLIGDYTEFCLVDQYIKQVNQEEDLVNQLRKAMPLFPIWNEHLLGVKGCGEKLASILIATLDPHKARHVASFWQICGYGVGWDGAGMSKRKEHMVQREYVSKEGKTEIKDSTVYDPRLKTHMFNVAEALLRQKDKYYDIYLGYKNRLENTPHWRDGLKPRRKDENGEWLPQEEWLNKSKKPVSRKWHRHMASIRYMNKMFLADLWVAWRELEGLPVTKPYHEDKLGMIPHGEESAA